MIKKKMKKNDVLNSLFYFLKSNCCYAPKYNISFEFRSCFSG